MWLGRFGCRALCCPTALSSFFCPPSSVASSDFSTEGGEPSCPFLINFASWCSEVAPHPALETGCPLPATEENLEEARGWERNAPHSLRPPPQLHTTLRGARYPCFPWVSVSWNAISGPHLLTAPQARRQAELSACVRACVGFSVQQQLALECRRARLCAPGLPHSINA